MSALKRETKAPVNYPLAALLCLCGLKIETATAALLTWMPQFSPKIPLWDEHQPLTYLSRHLCATCRTKPIILSQLWHGEEDMTKRTQQEQKKKPSQVPENLVLSLQTFIPQICVL